jgi:hypothetical protein
MKTGFPLGRQAQGRDQQQALVLTHLPARPRPAVEPVQHYFDTK